MEGKGPPNLIGCTSAVQLAREGLKPRECSRCIRSAAVAKMMARQISSRHSSNAAKVAGFCMGRKLTRQDGNLAKRTPAVCYDVLFRCTKDAGPHYRNAISMRCWRMATQPTCFCWMAVGFGLHACTQHSPSTPRFRLMSASLGAAFRPSTTAGLVGPQLSQCVQCRCG